MAIYVNGNKVLGNVKRNGVIPDKVKANGVTVWEKPIGALQKTVQVTVGLNYDIYGYYPFAGEGAISSNSYRGTTIKSIINYSNPAGTADFNIQLEKLSSPYAPASLITGIRLVGEDWGIFVPVSSTSTQLWEGKYYTNYLFLKAGARGIWAPYLGQVRTVEIFGN